MTTTEKIQRIAEKCGWKSVRDYTTCGQCEQISWFDTEPPDYFTDLNAMHEAENIITNEQVWDYCCRLGVITDAKGDPEYCAAEWNEVHATAAQRAEAFGLTMGLWKEGE